MLTRYYGSYVVRSLYMQQQVTTDEETSPSPHPLTFAPLALTSTRASTLTRPRAVAAREGLASGVFTKACQYAFGW